LKRTGVRKGVSTVVAALVVVVVVVAAGAIAIFLPSLYPSGKASAGATTSTGVTGPSSTYSSGSATISIPSGTGENQSLNFSPAAVRVVIGVNNTLVWTNNDRTPHTVVSTSVPAGAKAFSSDLLSQGGTYSVTLTVPGTYKYYCSVHPTWMIASITVVAG